MTHKHELGELLSEFFVAQRNKDQTEGRGPMVDMGTFLNPTDAHDAAKGQAVMGCGDGDIIKRSYYRCETCPEIVKIDEHVYYGDDYMKKHTLGGLGRYADFMSDGWSKDYSPLSNDPEYNEFLRLKRKFT